MLESECTSKIIAFIEIPEDREVFRRPTWPDVDEVDWDGSRNAANASLCEFAYIPRQI